MTTSEFLSHYWTFNPWALGVAALGIFVYFRCARVSSPSARVGWFVFSLTLFLAALCSPIEVLAGHYLFCAHMTQHLLLQLVIPLGCLLSWPVRNRALGDAPPRLERWLSQPWPAWLAGLGGMWIWHIPTMCDAATSSEALSNLQTLSLLFMGAWFWWPVAGPDPRLRLPGLHGIPYLFTACLGCTLLGVLISFTRTPVCSVFLHPPDNPAVLSLIREGWGLTPQVDQEIGGLIMWVPACLVYLLAILSALLRWYESNAVPVQPVSPGVKSP